MNPSCNDKSISSVRCRIWDYKQLFCDFQWIIQETKRKRRGEISKFQWRATHELVSFSNKFQVPQTTAIDRTSSDSDKHTLSGNISTMSRI